MGKLDNLKKFEKGNPGGPGRPKDPPELKAIKKLNKAEFELLVNKVLQASPEELQGFNKNILELCIASSIKSVIKSGDISKLNLLLDRLIGKTKEDVQISTIRQEIIKLDGTKIVYTNEPDEESNE